MILGRGVFASLVATHGLASFEQHIGAAIIGSYKNTFIHSIISADGSPEAQKLKLGARRQIPRDFIPVEKAAAKLSPEELEQRFGSWKSVDFRPEAEKGNSPQAGWTKEKFGPYLDGFRGLVSWVSTPFINGHFKKEFGRKFPNFTWGPDKRKIESPDDFIQYLENVEVTTPQELRALRDKVNFVCYVMYGKSHYWAVNAEGIIMEGLGLEYTEELSNGQKMQRRQRGGSIKAIMVKKLGEKTDAIRAKFEEIYLERFYVRDMFSPALVKLKEEKLVPRSMTAGKVTMALFDELDTSALEEKEERRICALFESACKIKYLIRATPLEHGCRGLILLLPGHVNRAKIDLEQRPVPDSTTEATSAENDKNAANTVRNATEAATTKETAKSSFDDGSFMDGKRMVIVPEATKHKKPRRDPAAVDANATLDIDKAAEDLARDGFKDISFQGDEQKTPKSTAKKGAARKNNKAVKKRNATTSPPNPKKKGSKVAKVTPEQKKKKTEAEVEAEIAEKNEKMAKKNQDTAKKHYNATDKTEAKMLKKEEKCKCHHPDHHDIASFLAYDKTYHTPEHRKGKDIPIECFCCEVKFTTGPPGAGLYKVAREGNLVYACKDAMDGELDTCIKAFCKPCYSKMLDKLPTGRSRKRTSAVMYGERMDANGNVTAS